MTAFNNFSREIFSDNWPVTATERTGYLMSKNNAWERWSWETYMVWTITSYPSSSLGWRASGWPRLRVQRTLYPPKLVKPPSHEFSLAPALKQLWEERRGLLKTEKQRKKIAQTHQIAINFFLYLNRKPKKALSNKALVGFTIALSVI